MAKYKDSEIVLSTGKKFYANNGIIGINDELSIYGGYDGHISLREYYPTESLHFSKEERKELAEYVISLWQKFTNLSDEEILKFEIG